MGLSGNALIPLVYGSIADNIGVQQAYWILLPCYTYLFFYAVKGHAIRKWR
jgi:fucose permease